MDCKQYYDSYFNILREELIPAAGCTEPIALAYAAAVATQHLGEIPNKVEIFASGNLIKNAKSVIVPNTGGMAGIAAATAAGIIAGQPDKNLEVIAKVSSEQLEDIKKFISRGIIHLDLLDDGKIFDCIMVLHGNDNNYVKVRISDSHTNIVLIEKNTEIIYSLESSENNGKAQTGRDILSLECIYDFAKNADIAKLKEVLKQQVEYNLAIAEFGLENQCGAGVGSASISENPSPRNKAKSMASAGSDARMSGCSMPVVITAGSGNQGLTASVPVIVYGMESGKNEEEILRALAFSDLITIHQKTGIGKLSAYCGAVSAAGSSACAIAFMENESYSVICDTLTNSLGILSGIICDGAKASCAGKIASSLDTAFLSYDLAKKQSAFQGGDGIVGSDIEQTIKNVGKLAKDGMKETDKEIINIMINKQ